MKDTMLGSYIAKTHSTTGFMENELRAIKSGDMDTIASTFIDLKNDTYMMQCVSLLTVLMECLLSSLMRMISDVN